jgi:Flp pilus assembly protein TadD
VAPPEGSGYRTALALDATDVAAYVNLADLQRSIGRDDVGGRILGEALAVIPDAPDIHHAVGLLRVRQGDLGAALPWLERAANDSREARFAYVYGVALASNGAVERGVRVLKGALRAHPHDCDILIALVTYSENPGSIDEAIRYAEHLAEVVPEDPDVQATSRRLRSARA